MININIHIIEGDFPKSELGFFNTYKKEFSFRKPLSLKNEKIPLNRLVSIELMTEEKFKKVSGALGWAVAGGVLTGGIGAIAGLMLGGNKNFATYLLEFDDGRTALCKSKNNDFTRLKFIADKRIIDKSIIEKTESQVKIPNQTKSNSTKEFTVKKRGLLSTKARLTIIGIFVIIFLIVFSTH